MELQESCAPFIAMSLFFLPVKFYAHWCRHVKVAPNDEVELFETQCVHFYCFVIMPQCNEFMLVRSQIPFF